jgi:amino acid adenylation domain-containing protein
MRNHQNSQAMSESFSTPSLAPSHPTERRSATVTHLVTQIAEANPERIALRAAGRELSYGELNTRADKLAAHLRYLGIGPDVAVGICLDRSFEQVIAAFAVLKAGGAYLPLDPTWPAQRHRALVQDAQAPVVITLAAMVNRFADDGRSIIALDRDADTLARPEGCVEPKISRENLAYVIYTSGSTGEPKGVEITHGNLLNLVFWHRHAFEVSADDRASHLAGLGFDASIWEIWPYLTAGATVALVDEAARSAPGLLQKWLIDEKINVAFVPTALAEPMIAMDWPSDTVLRFLLTGADTLHNYARPELPFTVVNNYGPTECAVVATSGKVAPSTASGMLPPIGRPIAHTQIHLLDENGEPVEPGETGEIYIGGTSVGRGYRNRPDLTAQRFVPDRFRQVEGARLYRTGDLGYQLPDGQIAFRGRIDNQEKIRGHRVEPDEITIVLNRHPLVASSAVVARTGASEKYLAAYVVPAAAGEPSAENLREFLAGSLPEYMIPASFVKLSTLPLTTSGKLDKKALPEPSPENALGQAGYAAPQTPAEQALAEIVTNVLKIDRVGRDDNFFLMGGHSLLGTQLVMRARETFGIDLTLRHLFEAQTVGKLAATIEKLVIEKLEAMSDEDVQRQIEQAQA